MFATWVTTAQALSTHGCVANGAHAVTIIFHEGRGDRGDVSMLFTARTSYLEHAFDLHEY